MARRSDPDDESGVLLRANDYPMIKRKPPAPADPDPVVGGQPPWKQRVAWKKVGVFGGVAVLGILIGYLISPSGTDAGAEAKQAVAASESKAKALQAELATTKDALATEQETTAKLTKDKAKLEPKVQEAKALQDKLAAVVGKQGEVTSADGEIRLQLVDKILFRTGQAELTAQGQEVLSSIGTALNEKDVEDKQIWVQGHTDDDPIFVPRPVKPSKGKGKGKAPPPPPPFVKYASNWELSAARALTVVHYLQDQVKVDPQRLAAVAFGQFRPASKVKAKNRRIEIVLYPKHSIVTPK